MPCRLAVFRQYHLVKCKEFTINDLMKSGGERAGSGALTTETLTKRHAPDVEASGDRRWLDVARFTQRMLAIRRRRRRGVLRRRRLR